MSKTTTAGTANSLPAAAGYRGSFWKNSFPFYLAAFLIPALLTFIAYALFGVYPFNERSVLTLDLNGQYVQYFEGIRDAFWGGRSALYSWERNLSGGFQGVIGYYLASPFTFIVILMPRKLILEALMIMQICKIGTAGVTFSVYARRSKNMKPLHSVIFATMYALIAFSAIQLIDPMWVDGPVFLPLIILGVEYLIDDGRKINYIIPLAIMFIANFYIGYMVAIFVAIYFVYYLFFGTQRKFRGVQEYARTFGLMVGATAVVLMCSYIMIGPVYNALALGKFDFSVPDYSFRTMFNPIELVPCLLPDQYYSVNVDEGTRMYGRPEIYCGVLTVVLLPLFYMNKDIKRNKKIGYSMLIAILFLSMWIKPINMMWHGGQDPNWLPYRYSFLMSFVLLSMAAEVFPRLESTKVSFKASAGIFAGIGLLVYLFSLQMEKFNYNEDKYPYVAKLPHKLSDSLGGTTTEHLLLGTIAFGVLLAALYLMFVYMFSNAGKKQARTAIVICLAVLVAFEEGVNIRDTLWKIHKEVYYSNHNTYDEIQSEPALVDELAEYDGGLYRAEKTFFRNVNDNQAWGLKGISHSSSVMNTRIINFIETLGYTTKSYETRYDGNTPVADSLLGIKYVFDDPKRNHDNTENLLSPYYNKIYSSKYINNSSREATVNVYENPDALAIGCMADDDILKLSFLGNDNPFNSMNNFMSSLTGNTPDYTSLVPKAYFKRLDEPTVELNECWESDYGGQHCYNANAGAADPTVKIHLTAEDSNYIYMYLKSDNPKKCNMWLGVKGEDGVYRGRYTGNDYLDSYGSYFEGYDYSIVNLGQFEPGEEIEIRLTIIQGDKTGNNEYIMVKDFQFYSLDYDSFHSDIQQLKQNEWQIDMDKSSDSYLVGEIDAPEGQILYTSIPIEPGWTIKVDGKKIPDLYTDSVNDSGMHIYQNDLSAADTGTVSILNALIGVKLTPGHHTISMKYSPPGFRTGIVLLILGIGLLVVFYLYDKKNNKVLLARAEAKERMLKGLPPVEPEAPAAAAGQRKVADIIKSKGAVAEKELVTAEEEAAKAAEAEAEKAEKLAAEVTDTLESDAAETEKKLSEAAPKPANKSGGKKKKKKKK
ncbi:MAG: YfhO family protein [Ruminococcus sp.]|nr:YfhO family protein [Ruminococcus sp.]